MEWDRKTWLKIAAVSGGTALLYWALNHFADLRTLFGGALGLLAPFLLGACIAFILNVPMRYLEKLLFRPSAKKGGKIPLGRFKRPISLVLTLVLVLSLLAFVVSPQLANVVRTVREAAPGFFLQLQDWSRGMLEKYPEISSTISSIEIDWKEVFTNVFKFLQSGVGGVVNSTVSIIGSVFNGATTFFLAFIFACYLLAQKETLLRQCKKLLYAHIKPPKVDRFLEICRLSDRTFSSFIRGQCLEAVILGCMFLVSMWIFRFPYALTVSVLVAFTALIPVFGAFIGCILGALLILMSDPVKALWFVVLFLTLQQVEGNLIYPRVVGSSVGLPGIWVLVAVTVGGSALGIVGMLVMVPLGSVIYALLRERTNRKLKEKHISAAKYQS